MIVTTPSTEIGTKGGRAWALAHSSHSAFRPEGASIGPGDLRQHDARELVPG
jgi:hypothetical protein